LSDETENEETTPVEEAPVEATPEAEAPAAEAPEAEAPAAEEPEAEAPAAEEPEAEAPAADEPEADAAPADEPAEDKPAAAAPADEPEEEGEKLPFKAGLRLERSRQPVEAKPQQTTEERTAARAKLRAEKAAARRRWRGKQKAKRAANPTAAKAATEPKAQSAGAQKFRQGIVVSDKGEKTITIRVDVARRHPRYEKIVRSSSTLRVHDESNDAHLGDTVKVIECRPMSRSKRWRLAEVLERAK